MATTVTGKLNRAANQFQAGESTGFGVSIGVKYRDPKTKQDDWTNYKAVIFAKSPGQIQFYADALVEGSVIELTGGSLKIDSYEGTNGVMLSIELLNAQLGFVHTANAPGQQAGYPQQQAPQQRQPVQQPVQQQAQQRVVPGGYAQPGQNNQQSYQQPQQMQEPQFDDDTIPF